MKRLKKLISVLIAFTMVFSIIPVTHIPAFAASTDMGVQFILDTAPNGAYKLVFQAKAPEGMMVLDVVFSFDNTIIKPVRSNNQNDVSVTDGGTQSAPFVVIAEDSEENPLTSAPMLWKVDGTRTAFHETIYTTDYVISSGNYVDMFEFYFKLQEEKTIDDIGESTFKFENGADVNGFVAKYFVSGEGAGIRLLDNNSTTYLWGAIDQTEYPNDIDEVINPFIISYTAEILPESKTFTSVTVGYGEQAAQEFTITNTGTGIITNLSAALTGGTSFEISTALSGDEIELSGTATISVRPKTGLTANTYTDTLTITGDNDISLSVLLSFTVNPPEPTYTLVWDGTTGSFEPLDHGYASGSTVTYTIKNTGNQPIANISATITTGSDNFEILTAPDTSLAVGASDTVLVGTKTGLNANTTPYSGILTVTWTGGDGTTGITQNLSQTVNKATVAITATAATGLVYNGSPQVGYTGLETTLNISELVYTYTGTGTTEYDSTTAPTNAGSYSLVISISSENTMYVGSSTEIEFTIAPKALTSAMITDIATGSSYTGSAQEPTVAVEDGGFITTDDYDVSYTDNINAGTDTATVTVTATATGNYTGEVSKNFSIAKGTITGTPQTVYVVEDYAQNYPFDLTSLLPAALSGVTVTYAPEITENTAGVLGSPLSYISGNTLTLPINAVTGIGKTAEVTVTISSANYEDFDAIITVITTDKIPVTISGLTAADDVYNKTPRVGYTGTPTIAVTAGGAAVNDAMSLVYLYENVGGATYSSVTAPTDAGTYKLTLSTSSSDKYKGSEAYTFTIMPKELTITGVTATNRAYDGTDVVAITGGTLVGVESGDTDTVTADVPSTGTITTAAVGTGKAVTIGEITLTGADAANYTLKQPTGITVNITPLAVTITGVTVEDKVYDGKTTATIDNSGTITDKIGSDDVTIVTTNATAAFADKNVADGKIVTFSGFALDGTDAGNYTLSAQPANSTANITAKSLTITGITAINREYDGTTIVNVTGGTLGGVILGDTVNPAVPLTGTADNADIGTDKGVTIGTISLSGTDAGNYTLTQPTGITVNITAKEISGVVSISSNGTVGDPIAIGDTLKAEIADVIPSGATLTYAWSGTDVTGATATYTVVAGNSGTITVTVTGTGNYSGTLTASIEVDKIPLSGTIDIDVDSDLLTLDTTALGSGIVATDYTIQWLRDGEVISGATGISYTLTEADRGKIITVQLVGIGNYTGTLSDGEAINAVVPDAPRNLVAVPGNEQVTLTWDAPIFDGGSDITHYEVYDVIADDGTWINVGLNTSYVYTALTNDTAYTFKVHAINSAGNGAEATVNATPKAPVKSITVGIQNGTLTAGTAGSVTFDVTTEYITDGTYFVTLNGAPAGITAGNLTITGNVGTLTITTTAAVTANTYHLTITIDSTTSNSFNLTVSPAGSTPPGPTYRAITATAGTGGSISPSGNVQIAGGANQTFYISANAGYVISNVMVDGVSQGAISSYTFTNVTANHTITASFTYVGGGTIPPSPPVVVPNPPQPTPEPDDKPEAAPTVTIVPNVVQTITNDPYWRETKEPNIIVRPATTQSTPNQSNPTTTSWENPFEDVNPDDWFYDDVKYMQQNGLILGTSSTTFSPNLTMTGGMVLTILGRLAKRDAVEGEIYYEAYVEWAMENGLLDGIEDFDPTKDITREDLAVILYNYAKLMGIELPKTNDAKKFGDGSAISDYAVEAVAAMQRTGVINGYTNGTFKPQGTATRAEVAAMLHRFIEAIK